MIDVWGDPKQNYFDRVLECIKKKEEKCAKNSKRKYGVKNEETGKVSSIDRYETEMMIEKEDKFMDRSKIGLRKCRPPISVLIKKTLPNSGVQICDIQT